MEEKNEIKIRLGTVVSIFIIFVLIVALGIVYYLGFIADNSSNKEVASLETNNEKLQVSNNDNVNNIESTKEDKNDEVKDDNKSKEISSNDYITNFSSSVAKELGSANEISVDSAVNGYFGVNSLSVNANSEAYIQLNEDSKLYKKYGENYKLSNNVANVYCYKMGNGINEYIFLIKTDGTVEYIHLQDDDNNSLKLTKLKKVKDITNIIQISGGDADGIGGYGVLFITSDGNCVPYFEID